MNRRFDSCTVFPSAYVQRSSEMRTIDFTCTEIVALEPAVISERISSVERWTEFKGYGIVPGIAKAAYEIRTDSQIGSRVRVRNTDGSSHTEEFIAWAPGERALLRMSGFSPPLNWLTSHIVEEWTLASEPNGTMITRRFSLQPTHKAGRLLLSLIAPLLRRAVARHLTQIQREAKATPGPQVRTDGV
jgi:hypothetical protein